MAILSINVPNAVTAEVGNYVALARGYTGFLPDGTTPETKLAFVTRMLVEQLKDWAAVGKRIEAERGVNEATYRDSLGIA